MPETSEGTRIDENWLKKKEKKKSWSHRGNITLT